MAGLPVRRAADRGGDELSPADASVLELVDRLLHKGVVLTGEATISVAGIDLIYLGLNVVLAAAETIEQKIERKAS
jgi:gas vesicle structural protein